MIPAADCLSLAPDGRWLVYVEDTDRVSANGEQPDSRWPRYRPVSLDLTTGQRTVHHCPADLEFGLPHPPALQNRAVAESFKPYALTLCRTPSITHSSQVQALDRLSHNFF